MTPLRVLVLGGTAWLGSTLAAEAVRRGHEVVCLARGSAAAPPGARLIRGDRTEVHGYRDVAGERWDTVLDVTRDPAQVATAADAVEADWYGFVSTGNVYADTATRHLDEDAALLDPDAEPRDPGEAYGMGKVRCERIVRAAFPRSCVARAGLIGGSGDPTGRSTYWPWRFAHPAGPVLVPDTGDRPTELIDVRDLAGWLVDAAERRTEGVFNAVGPEVTFAEHLRVAQSVAGFAGDVATAPESWLIEEGVEEWAGPRSLPLWLADPAWRGFQARDGSRARAAGLTHRPLAETLRDALVWEETQPAHPHGAGLTDEEERDLLRRLVGTCGNSSPAKCSRTLSL